MADRVRQTFKAQFRGMNTREPPDALPPGKVPLAVNIRADGDAKVRTRPGYEQTFNNAGAGPITDIIASYDTLNTDNKPRILVHDQDGKVFLDDGLIKGTVGTGGTGASIIPFRPSASPQSWAYIGNATGYMKFSAPDANNNVIAQKVGIAEPQPMPEAVPDGFEYTDFTGTAASWEGDPHAIDPVTNLPFPSPGGDVHNSQGTPGLLDNVVRSTNHVLNVFADTVRPPNAVKYRYSLMMGLTDETPGGNVGKPINYQIGQTLSFYPQGTPLPGVGGCPAPASLPAGVVQGVIEDVYPPIQIGSGIVIEQIYYFDQIGESRRCVIVPSQLGFGTVSAVPNIATNSPPTAVLPDFAGTTATLRRGSLISVGGETCFVENVTLGPTGSLAIETRTSFLTGTTGHHPGERIEGVLAICVSFPQAFNANSLDGATAIACQINFAMLKGGLAIVMQDLPTNPFNQSLGDMGVPQDNDYFHISLTVVGNPQSLVQIKISFDIDDGTFLRNTLYYPVSEAVLQAAMNNSQSQFTVSTLLATNSTVYNAIYNELKREGYNPASVLNPNNAISINTSTGKVQIIATDGRLISLNVPLMTGYEQYTEIQITLSNFTRTGNNMTRTLADTTAIQIAVITKAFASGEQMVIGFGSIWVGGGGQPDTGVNASPYFYRVIGRNSLTGVVSNPTAGTRYGVMPRTQPVWVQLTASTGGSVPIYDPQIDTWDIFRYGGTITSWRYAGSANVNDLWFKDNIFDSQAAAGDQLEFDNYEPWPTVDVPWKAQVGINGITEIEIIGTAINVFGSDFSFPATISHWLVGTLITVNQNTVYTLWNRPVPLPAAAIPPGLATVGWQFRIIETAGAMTNPVLFIQEPIVANQPLPYLWGPDANGFMFGCGDPFRPGTFQTSKAYNPDATANNAHDLVPPSEPVLGGQIMDGLSLVASSKRWWMLQPSQDPAQWWNPVEMPTGRGLAAPYAHTTDGKMVYFWAKDGIWSMVPNQPGQPLTNDIANLFPQGETGITHGFDITYAGYTIYAPEYRYVAYFRLSVMNFMLRAHYRDCSGTPRTLVCDMTPDAAGQLVLRWSVDDYRDPIVASLQPDQPPATLLSTTAPTRYQEFYYVDTNGGVWQETDLHNDGPFPFESWFATPEFDGGDTRVRKDFMDSMVDILPPSGGNLSLVANGKTFGSGAELPTDDERIQRLIPVGEERPGEPVKDVISAGIVFRWRDDFTILNPNPTSCPTSGLVTTLYEWSMEYVPQPVLIRSWESLWVTCGLDCYWFIYRLRIAYETEGDEPVRLFINAYDRNRPEIIELPGTNGEYRKTEFVPTFNKFMMAKFHATCPTDFALIEEDCEIVACQWGRTGACIKCNGLGGNANP